MTADIIEVNGVERVVAATGYARAIADAGAIPIVLPPRPEEAIDLLALCDAVVFTGGDDPTTEPFGAPTDSRVTPVHEERQRAESTMLEHLALQSPDTPVLGICLGMQMMALHAGGRLDQWMPDTTPSHGDHWEADHEVHPTGPSALSTGIVRSKHRQAVADAGEMHVTAIAHDGVIEAVGHSGRRFYLGVQWHPERTGFAPLGADLFRRLVRSCS